MASIKTPFVGCLLIIELKENLSKNLINRNNSSDYRPWITVRDENEEMEKQGERTNSSS